MDKRILFVGFSVVYFALLAVSAASVDFSGNWILSQTIPPRSAPGEILLIIRQTGNDLFVIRTTVRDGESISTESHYTFDGAENINTVPNAAGEITIRSKSRWNNRNLILDGSSTFAGDKGDVTGKWKREYSLSSDGATLILVETHPTPFGEVEVALVFSRNGNTRLPG